MFIPGNTSTTTAAQALKEAGAACSMPWYFHLGQRITPPQPQVILEESIILLGHFLSNKYTAKAALEFASSATKRHLI